MNNPAQDLSFGSYRLQGGTGSLYNDTEEVSLRPKSLEVLWYLAMRPGEIVSKDTLLAAVWPRTLISDTGLAVCVREIRQALGDDSHAPRYIQTVHRRGYRFIASFNVQPAHVHRLIPGATATTLLVGRTDELQQLEHGYRQACNGQRQLLFVSGAAGIGKTTLVTEWLRHLNRTQQVRLGCGQCVEHVGNGEAYLPLLEALSRLCQGPQGEATIVALRRYGPKVLLQLPEVLDESEREALCKQVQEVTAEGMQRQMVDTLEALSVEQPLVLLLEDLHWSDPSTVEVLALLAQRQEPAQLLVIGTFRPVELIVREHPLKTAKQEMTHHGHCRELALGNLNESAVRTYIQNRFSGPVSGQVMETIYQRTEGHPLYMVMLADHLSGQDLLSEPPPPALETLETALPVGLQQFIELQLERLGSAEQQVLEAASVAGMEFAVNTVAAALGKSEAAVEATCEMLNRRGQFIADSGVKIWPDETVNGSYVFCHALYPEVCYSRIGSGRRVRLHRLIGEHLEQGFAAQSHAVDSELALHFEQAGDVDRAIKYLQRAAGTALGLYANQEAGRLLQQALSLMETHPAIPERERRELELRLALGPVLIALEGYAAPAVKDNFDRAKALGRTLEQFPVLRGLAAFYIIRAEYHTTRELGHQLLDLAKNADPPNPGYAVESHLMLGTMHYFMGDFDAARNQLQQTITLYDPQMHHVHASHYGVDPGVLGLSFIAITLWSLGYPDQALAKARQALALAEELAHPYSLAQCQSVVCYLHQQRRDVEQTRELAAATLAVAEKQGFPYVAAGAKVRCGWAQVQTGQAREGITLIQQGLKAYQATGAIGAITILQAVLVEAYTLNHQVEEGLNLVDEALAMVNATQERFCEAELLRLKGSLLLQQNCAKANGEAEACLQQALTIARRQQAKVWELRTATTLAQGWENLGQHNEALLLLAPVYNKFSEGFDTADLQQAKALLNELERHCRPSPT